MHRIVEQHGHAQPVQPQTGGCLGLHEAVAIAVHFEDMDVVRQAFEERAGEAF